MHRANQAAPAIGLTPLFVDDYLASQGIRERWLNAVEKVEKDHDVSDFRAQSVLSHHFVEGTGKARISLLLPLVFVEILADDLTPCPSAL